FNHSGIYAFAQDYGSLSFPNAKHWGLTRRVVKKFKIFIIANKLFNQSAFA
ncbi:MAG: hypothetical protein UW91_C0021G0001, partial [Parcubacteria group bacterium GW2011_GWF2_45_11]